MPKVSVIIPAYNAAEYICEALDSVFGQTYKDYEIIVVDDGSKDGTQRTLDHYGDLLKYIYQDNRGVSAARNKGIREASGEYIAFLDADDIWLEDKLMAQIALAEQSPGIDFIFSDTESFNKKGPLGTSSRPKNARQYDVQSFRHKIAISFFNDGSVYKGDFYKDLLLGNMIPMSTVLIRKESLKKVGYFDEKLHLSEDYDMWLRIARRGIILYFNAVTARYRFRDDSSSGDVNLRKFIYKASGARVLEKQWRDCSIIYRSLIKKRILECYRTAIWVYFNLRELKEVRTLCFRSLRFDKFQMKLYMYIIATFLPVNFIKSKTKLV